MNKCSIPCRDSNSTAELPPNACGVVQYIYMATPERTAGDRMCTVARVTTLLYFFKKADRGDIFIVHYQK